MSTTKVKAYKAKTWTSESNKKYMPWLMTDITVTSTITEIKKSN